MEEIEKPSLATEISPYSSEHLMGWGPDRFLQWLLRKSDLPVTKTKSVTFTHIKLNSEFSNSSSQSHCCEFGKGGIVKLLIFFFL